VVKYHEQLWTKNHEPSDIIMNKNFKDLNIQEQVELITKALEEEVYTAMAMHGGGLDIVDVKGNTVYISYQGACVGCPMAESGTLLFVENTLKEKIDKDIEVKISN